MFSTITRLSAPRDTFPGPTDVYVSLGQVKKYNLRKGDAVIGAIRQPREGENQGRQKYNALVSVDTINGQSVDEAANRVDFQALHRCLPHRAHPHGNYQG
jgi:transcription termination factor Rho